MLKEFTKVDKFNAKNSAVAVADVLGQNLKLISAAQYSDEIRNLETGEKEVGTVSAFKVLHDGMEVIVTTPSATVANAYDDLIDVANEAEVTFTFVEKKSGNNRKFYSLQLIEVI